MRAEWCVPESPTSESGTTAAGPVLACAVGSSVEWIMSVCGRHGSCLLPGLVLFVLYTRNEAFARTT